MPKEQYFGDGIPDRLRQLSVEGMPIEKLYILDTVMDDSELSDLGDEVEFNNDAIYRQNSGRRSGQTGYR